MTLTEDGFGGRWLAPATSNRHKSRTSHIKTLYTLHLAAFSAVAVAALLLVTACTRGLQSNQSVPADNEWRQFQGTWTAAGNRDSITLGDGRRASIAKLEGSLVLAGPSRPGVGFRAEALVLNDSATGTIGRAVWTDNHGDQVFSELKGQGTSTGSHIVGNFLGGTGRYLGATGTYEFTWRFVIDTDDGNVQGQSEGLNGRIRVGSAQAPPDAGDLR